MLLQEVICVAMQVVSVNGVHFKECRTPIPWQLVISCALWVPTIVALANPCPATL